MHFLVKIYVSYDAKIWSFVGYRDLKGQIDGYRDVMFIWFWYENWGSLTFKIINSWTLRKKWISKYKYFSIVSVLWMHPNPWKDPFYIWGNGKTIRVVTWLDPFYIPGNSKNIRVVVWLDPYYILRNSNKIRWE